MANYTRLASDDKVIYTEKVTTNTWTNNSNNLVTAFTSSLQADFSSPSSSGYFYIDVYQTGSQDSTAEVQYSVAYGHKNGSGSMDFTNDTGSFGLSATKCTYNQYRNLVFGDSSQEFTFGTHTPDHIYVINMSRARYKHAIKPGALNLKLSGSVGGFLLLTDDSVTQTGSTTLTNVGRQFNIVSGADGVMSGSQLGQIGGSSSYGLFYPDAGFMILNPDNVGSFLTNLNPAENPNCSGCKNNEKLQRSLKDGAYFISDSEEQVTSQYYFIRLKNQDYNYSTNPTFKLTNGNLRFTSMHDNPRTYITTIGLYNDNSELLAVAKLSQPLSKDFSKEALIRCKLEY